MFLRVRNGVEISREISESREDVVLGIGIESC